MTLSRFLRDFIYIPLGGNQKGKWKTYRNLMITMVLGGLWHGAAWGFVLWGAIHGARAGRSSACSTAASRPPRWLRWLFVFHVVVLAWVLFRAPNFGDRGRGVRAACSLGLGYALRSGRGDRDRSGHRAAAAARAPDRRAAPPARGAQPRRPGRAWPSPSSSSAPRSPAARYRPSSTSSSDHAPECPAWPHRPRRGGATSPRATRAGHRHRRVLPGHPRGRVGPPRRQGDVARAGSARWCSPSVSRPAGSPTSCRSRAWSPTPPSR